MSDIPGGGLGNYLKKGREVDPTGIEPASKRRHVWEMFADVRVMNNYLLVFSGLSSVAAALMAIVVFTIYTRPPYILTEDEGYVLWRTTETFQVRPDMVSSFLWLVMGKIFNVTPGAYDLTSISKMVAPVIIDAYSGKVAQEYGERINRDRRQFFDILEIRKVVKSEYPEYLSYIVKANVSSMSEGRDQAGNVVTTTAADTFYYTVWLAQDRPTPDNPWGLVLVGVGAVLKGKDGDAAWAQSVPLMSKPEEGEKGDGQPVQVAQ